MNKSREEATSAMSASGTKRTSQSTHLMSVFGGPAGSACYFFTIIVIRHKTAAATHWALLLIVCTLFNDAIIVARWTGFHVCLPVDTFAGLFGARKPRLGRSWR
jgi:hypothetical protein